MSCGCVYVCACDLERMYWERAMKANKSWTSFFPIGFAVPFQDKEKALSKRKCMYIP